MKILKFGGTSVGSADRMRDVSKLINDGEPKIVVLSAMSGTTNKLVEISGYLYKNNFETANELIYKLEVNYSGVIEGLYVSSDKKTEAKNVLKPFFATIKSYVGKDFDEIGEKEILAQGEMMSTNLFHLFLSEQGIDSQLLPALEYMKTNENGEPDYGFISLHLKSMVEKYPQQKLFITQGFICKNIKNEVDNLQRGGSDYTASIVGAAINASEIQIWTDIDGMHNNDPRFVEGTHSIERLSFDEAAELAYFGAKILHPTSILPAKYSNIPVILKNTMESTAAGTTIAETEKAGIKAIAAKDSITMIKIKSGRMLLAYGFLRKIFEIFENYHTSIDMVTTSEVGMSLTIDNTKFLPKIIEEIKTYGDVMVIEEQSIVCIVGYLIGEQVGIKEKIFRALTDIPVQMISYGGSLHNISVLINTKDKHEALKKLNVHLF